MNQKAKPLLTGGLDEKKFPLRKSWYRIRKNDYHIRFDHLKSVPYGLFTHNIIAQPSITHLIVNYVLIISNSGFLLCTFAGFRCAKQRICQEVSQIYL